MEVHIAGNSASSIAIIEQAVPNVAILDIDLGDTTCVEGELGLVPAALRDHVVLDKPYLTAAVAGALKEALLPHLIGAVLTKLS